MPNKCELALAINVLFKLFSLSLWKKDPKDSNTDIQAYIRGIAASVLDQCNKVNIAMKQATQSVWFFSVYKSYVYTILYSIKCAVAFC